MDLVYTILFPKIRERTNSNKKITNNILAIPTALAAIPEKPKTAATSAKIINDILHLNIMYIFKVTNQLYILKPCTVKI